LLFFNVWVFSTVKARSCPLIVIIFGLSFPFYYSFIIYNCRNGNYCVSSTKYRNQGAHHDYVEVQENRGTIILRICLLFKLAHNNQHLELAYLFFFRCSIIFDFCIYRNTFCHIQPKVGDPLADFHYVKQSTRCERKVLSHINSHLTQHKKIVSAVDVIR
jgi:hypothetical protein